MNGRSIVPAGGFWTGQLRQAEIEDLHPAIAGDKKILRLEVAMDDALLVRRRKSPCHLQPVVNRLADGKRATPQPLAQRLPFQQLGDHVKRAVPGSDVEDRKNVGMIQSPGRAGFLFEALHPVAIGRE